jgi:acetyl-CoA carboxylase carboxyltransferase component
MPRSTDTPQASPTVVETHVDATSARYEKNMRAMAETVAQIRNQEEKLLEGGGAKAVESQHNKGRLTVRERLRLLLDTDSEFLELGLFAANGMYEEWGGAPAAWLPDSDGFKRDW